MLRASNPSTLRIAQASVSVSAAVCLTLWLVWLVSSALSLVAARRELFEEGITLDGVNVYYQGLASSSCALPPLEWLRSRNESAHLLVRRASHDPLSRNRRWGRVSASSLTFEERGELSRVLGGELFSGLLAAMEEASYCLSAKFARDYSMGPFADPGPMPEVASLVKLIAIHSALAEEKRGTPRPVEILEVCSRMAKFGTNDSILPGWFSGVSIDQTVVEASQVVLSSQLEENFDPRHWQNLLSSWKMKEISAPRSLASVVENELVYSARWGMSEMLMGKTTPSQLSEVLGGSPSWWRVKTLAYRTVLLPMALSDAAEYLEHGTRLRAHLLRLEPHRLPSPQHPVTAALAKWSFGLPETLATHVTRLRLAQVGIALETYRYTYGFYPSSLSDLDLPLSKTMDPFTGEPFVYVPSPGGPTVYSLGANGSDERGRERLAGSGDIAWKITRPPRPPVSLIK